MASLTLALPYVQMALAILLGASILLQQTGAGLGEAFGGSGDVVGMHTRRGPEKLLFQATIVISILFAASAVSALVI
jgi:protein translocase SecG subunit